MLIIGLTGGTGCGKTTALQQVALRGGCALDCDAIYHELLQTDPALLQAIAAHFPAAVPEGVLDIKALGKLVFADRRKLEKLNFITHRFVAQVVNTRLEQARQAGCPLAAIDAIALLESGLAARCDVTVAVLAPEALRVQRLLAREQISEEYARARIRAQKDDQYYTSQCDYVLYNDCPTREAFAARCDALLDLIASSAAGTAR